MMVIDASLGQTAETHLYCGFKSWETLEKNRADKVRRQHLHHIFTAPVCFQSDLESTYMLRLSWHTCVRCQVRMGTSPAQSLLLGETPTEGAAGIPVLRYIP